MGVELTFGQIEAVCVAMNDISSVKRAAFTSRLKHLMQAVAKAEERPNEGPGRGRAAKFTFTQLMKVVVAVELIQAGTPPALAAKLVTGNWLQLRVGVHFALFSEVQKRAAGDPREETYWILAPEALRELSAAGEGRFDHYEAFQSVYRPDDLLKHFTEHEVGGVTGHYRRQLVLNGTAITKAAAFLLSMEMHVASIQELQQELYSEMQHDMRRIDDAVKEMALGELSEESSKKISKMLPAFQAFDERWEAKVLSVVDKLSQEQRVILSAELGSEVEIQYEDILALRKWDLIALEKGELVITDLGQEVAAELRRRAGKDEPLSPSFRRQMERTGEMMQRLKEGDRDGDSQ